jgi:gas vesicle protein
MVEVNSMYHAQTRSDALKSQVEKLEGLAHRTGTDPTFEQFDTETEDLLSNIYGANHRYVEAYKYATVGEAEALVNLPESAQEPLTRDISKKGLQQRRQALQGILTELQELEAQEAEMLTGEDHEDPPGPS